MTAIETAWKIHAAQVDWTGKVDTKASFAFAIQSAALGLTVALSATGRIYSAFPGALGHTLYSAGLCALLAGAALALNVVVPRLRAEDLRAEASDNYIYFGHLRHWEPAVLAARLDDESDLLDVLARQCVIMAKIAWRKHRLVQASMSLGGAGVGLLVVAGVLATTS